KDGALSRMRFVDNQVHRGAGGLAVLSGTLSITDSLFISNSGTTGGGLNLVLTSGKGRIVNTLFARNQAGGGAAIAVTGTASVDVLFTTIADTAINAASAIAVGGGIVAITDSIIVSHSVGISQTGGSVREDYN